MDKHRVGGGGGEGEGEGEGERRSRICHRLTASLFL